MKKAKFFGELIAYLAVAVLLAGMVGALLIAIDLVVWLWRHV